jgi:DNA-binding response OmpR family regulator
LAEFTFMSPSADRKRILIVEDEWMIASQIESIVHDAGFEVVGPVGELTAALALANSEKISAALLDVELGPTAEVYPVADALRRRRIPYAFVSSRPRHLIAPEHSDRPLVSKPIEPATIEMVLNTLARCGSR